MEAPELLKVSIVEDSLAFQRLIASHTRQLFPEARLSISDTAQDALLAIQRQPPDLLILDLHLKEGSGLDVLDGISADGLSVPVLIVTGNSSDHDLDSALRSGAEDFLIKPIDGLVFRSKVESLLRKRYLSPFSFLGNGRSELAAARLTFPATVACLAEDSAVVASPVLVPKGKTVRLQLPEITLMAKVVKCAPREKREDGWWLSCQISGDLDFEERLRVRRLIVQQFLLSNCQEDTKRG